VQPLQEAAAKTWVTQMGKKFTTDGTDGFQGEIPSSVASVNLCFKPPRSSERED
jgi:hypothetical protein